MKKILVRRPVIMVQTLTYHHLSFKTFTLHSPWPYVTLSVFTTLLICFFAHRLWNKFKQTDKTTIHFELTTVTDCMILPIASLPLCHDNWHIQPPDNLITLSYAEHVTEHICQLMHPVLQFKINTPTNQSTFH